MRSFRAVCISLQEKQNSSTCTIHDLTGTRTPPSFSSQMCFFYHSSNPWVFSSKDNFYSRKSNWDNRTIEACQPVNLINCEINARGATMTRCRNKVGTSWATWHPSCTSSCTGCWSHWLTLTAPILSTNLNTGQGSLLSTPVHFGFNTPRVCCVHSIWFKCLYLACLWEWIWGHLIP